MMERYRYTGPFEFKICDLRTCFGFELFGGALFGGGRVLILVRTILG